MVRKIYKKNKKHLRNLEAENSSKFKKHPGRPKNLVSYIKKNVYSNDMMNNATISDDEVVASYGPPRSVF